MHRVGKGFGLGMLFLCWGCLLQAADLTPDKMVVYKRVDDVELKLHIFEPPDRQANKPVPAIVFFFGGGWVGGTPTQFYHQCDYLASRGMMAISAEYRIKSKHGTTPFECVADGKSAIRWVRANAERLGINPDKIVAGGGSAGGHSTIVWGRDLSMSFRPPLPRLITASSIAGR